MQQSCSWLPWGTWRTEPAPLSGTALVPRMSRQLTQLYPKINTVCLPRQVYHIHHHVLLMHLGKIHFVPRWKQDICSIIISVNFCCYSIIFRDLIILSVLWGGLAPPLWYLGTTLQTGFVLVRAVGEYGFLQSHHVLTRLYWYASFPQGCRQKIS